MSITIRGLPADEHFLVGLTRMPRMSSTPLAALRVTLTNGERQTLGLELGSRSAADPFGPLGPRAIPTLVDSRVRVRNWVQVAAPKSPLGLVCCAGSTK
jgi:hypothetical protein